VSGSIEEGPTETRGDGAGAVRHFLLRLPRPVAGVWRAVASPEGLAEWLTAAEVFEPRLTRSRPKAVGTA
jgi:uncharacterized protein YndB with AHSA1/START domain